MTTREKQHYDADELRVRLHDPANGSGREFFITLEQRDAVVTLLRAQGFDVALAGPWRNMPNAVAAIGGYPVGESFAAGKYPLLESETWTMFERTTMRVWLAGEWSVKALPQPDL